MAGRKQRRAGGFFNETDGIQAIFIHIANHYNSLLLSGLEGVAKTES